MLKHLIFVFTLDREKLYLRMNYNLINIVCLHFNCFNYCCNLKELCIKKEKQFQNKLHDSLKVYTSHYKFQVA